MRETLAAPRQGPMPGEAMPALRPRGFVVVAAVLLVLAVVSIAVRPLVPVDETRYASVAWEMWHRGSFWVPYLNGEPYDHKPPALFWLIHLGWWIGGIGEVWPRLIGPLSTLASGVLLAGLGRRLWPQQRGLGPLAAMMLLGSFFVAAYSTMLMFDMPLLACVVAAWIGLWDAARRGRRRDWALFGAALGVGLIVKGPVALVYTLPPLLLMRHWRPADAGPLRWSGVALALLLALAPGGAWLSLAAADGSASYLHHLLVDQTVQRVAGDLGHQRPLWWYLPFVVLLPMPWPLWTDAWRAVARLPARRAEPGVRFAIVTLGVAFVILCLVHGKQVHYLIPLPALGSLLLARGLHALSASGHRASPLPALTLSVIFLGLVAAAVQWAPGDLRGASLAGLFAAPVLAFAPLLLLVGIDDVLESAKRFAVANGLTVLALVAIVGPLGAPVWDLRPAAAHVASAEARAQPVAFVGKYQGEFGFLGRLRHPVTELRAADALAWARAHPDGLLVVRRKRIALVGDPPIEFRRPYKSDELLMLRGDVIVGSGSTFRDVASPRAAAPAPRQGAGHG